MKTIALHTLGCRLNQSETSVIKKTFESYGFRIVTKNQLCDIAVINTCTVTERGDADTRKLINKIVRNNPSVEIALIGCQAETQKDKLWNLPNVKWIIGTAKKMEVAKLLSDEHYRVDQQMTIEPIPKNNFTLPTAESDNQHVRANVKIQDGCNFFCSFCAIPYARGRPRSREFNDIIREASTLAQAGHKEIVLTGINVGLYQHNTYTLIDVISALEQIDPLERIRISSIEFTTIPDSLLKKMLAKTKLCRFLHIPLQSASDPILKAMNRRYSFVEYKSFIEKIKNLNPQICLGSDIIVGFPEESQYDFEATKDALENIPLDYFHVFSYSKRSMAKSSLMQANIDPSTVQTRSRILREMSCLKRQKFYRSFLGTTQQVLFEQKKQEYWSGLTDNYIRAYDLCQKDIKNQLRNVTFDEFSDNVIIGNLTNTNN